MRHAARQRGARARDRRARHRRGAARHRCSSAACRPSRCSTGEYGAARRPWAMRYVNSALKRDRAPRLQARADQRRLDRRRRAADAARRHQPPRRRHDRPEAHHVHLPGDLRRRDVRQVHGTRPRESARRLRAPPHQLRPRPPRRLARRQSRLLLGLNPDVAFEMVAPTLHVEHLLQSRHGGLPLDAAPASHRGAAARHGRGVDDDDFVRLLALLSLALPDAKIVLTTREPREIQQRVAPIVSVLSAGSSAVAPYTEDGARFPLETSQFEVIDQRPFEDDPPRAPRRGGRDRELPAVLRGRWSWGGGRFAAATMTRVTPSTGTSWRPRRASASCRRRPR